MRFQPIRVREYKQFRKILDESVYLVLDLEYDVDYSLNDVDEVKKGNFDRKLLKIMYNNSNVDDYFMEYWNMHTFSNKIIEPSKIRLVKVGDSFKASDVLLYMRQNANIKIKKDLPILYDYFQWLDCQK